MTVRILTFSDYYYPGHKGGGPIRTVLNMVERLGDEYDFRVVTRDRDLGDTKSYPTVKAGAWLPVGKAKVRYLSPRELSLRRMRALLSTTEYDAVYLNSFFSTAFTIKPLILRRLGLVPRVPFIVAPRGEFSLGALSLKGSKKRAYLKVARAAGLYQGLAWQASSSYEEEDIRRSFGKHIPVSVAPDLPPTVEEHRESARRSRKATGHLKVLFLSRISRTKNLHSALEILGSSEGRIQFDIYGPVEDARYWRECTDLIDRLPHNVRASYRGAVAHAEVGKVMAGYDLFFLPTLGENFGYVILEALLAGCPVLISDRTPWRNLREQGVGWDLPLEEPEGFREVLQGCAEMDAEVYESWSRRARAFGIQHVADETLVQRYRALFANALYGPVPR